MMEGLQLNIPQRLNLVRSIITVSMMVSMLLSINLWVGYRTFPNTPVVTGSFISGGLSYLLLCLVLLFWMFSLVLKWRRLFLFLGLLLNVLFVLDDVNRLQPWVYFFSAMLFLFVCYNGRVDNSNRFTSYFIFLQIVVASVYFFSGLHQLRYLNSEEGANFTQFLEPLKHLLSERQFLFVLKISIFVPYLLMAIGIGLIIKPVRYLAVSFVLMFHIMMLFFLFPSPTHQNTAMWFINISFALLVLVLFSGKTKQRYFSPALLFKKPLFYATVLLFVILPFLNGARIWPDYLSSNFSSEWATQKGIPIQEHVYNKLPLYHKTFCITEQYYFRFDYNRWCNHELKVSCYPGKDVTTTIEKYLHALETSPVKETELALSTP